MVWSLVTLMSCFGREVWRKGCLGEGSGENNKRGNVDLEYRLILYRRLFCKVEQRNEMGPEEGYEVKKDLFNDVCMLMGVSG